MTCTVHSCVSLISKENFQKQSWAFTGLGKNNFPSQLLEQLFEELLLINSTVKWCSMYKFLHTDIVPTQWTTLSSFLRRPDTAMVSISHSENSELTLRILSFRYNAIPIYIISIPNTKYSLTKLTLCWAAAGEYHLRGPCNTCTNENNSVRVEGLQNQYTFHLHITRMKVFTYKLRLQSAHNRERCRFLSFTLFNWSGCVSNEVKR